MPGFMPGIHVFADSTGKDGDGRDKPGHHPLKSLLNFFAHHTGTTQWILSFPVLRSLGLSSMSVLGRLAFGR
jgi:hypothetical protein